MIHFRCSALTPNEMREHRKVAHKESTRVNVALYRREVPEGYYDLRACPDCTFRGFTQQDLRQHTCIAKKQKKHW